MLNASSLKTEKKTVVQHVLRVIQFFFIFIALVILVVFLMNIKDEKLKPEVLAALQAPTYQLADQDNAYFMMIYLGSHQQFLPLVDGARIFNTAEAHYYANPSKQSINLLPAKKTDLPSIDFTWMSCIRNKENCQNNLINNRALYQNQINQSHVLLARYEQLTSMTQYEEHFIPSIHFSPEYKPTVQAATMTIAKASLHIHDQQIETGLQIFKKNNAFLRMALVNTKNLISRSIMTHVLERQTYALSELIRLYPQLITEHKKIILELIEPLNEAEQDFTEVFINERNLMLSEFLYMDEEIIEYKSAYQQYFDDFLKIIKHNNIIVNSTYDFYQILLPFSKIDSLQFEENAKIISNESKKKLNASLFPYFNFISKKIANVMLSFNILESKFSYAHKSLNLNALYRLVNLQVDIKDKNIPHNQIQDYLKNTPKHLRNPYNHQPMQWDLKTNQLEMNGKNHLYYEKQALLISISL